MRERAVAAGIGAVFGATLCWSGMISPEVLRAALLLDDSYLFLFFGSAVLTAAVGLRVLRSLRSRAALVDAPVGWQSERVERRHVAGALVFGAGWAVAAACPGPVLAQVGQGVGFGAFTLAGIVAGVWLFLRRGARETEPTVERSGLLAPGPS